MEQRDFRNRTVAGLRNDREFILSMPGPLTTRQFEVLGFIRAELRKRGEPVSLS